ncbi:MAG: polymerase subunit sigma [Jatrophihabitans sp.]|nr:polymerase subunit sigma [Jatrophihabitans sp.]
MDTNNAATEAQFAEVWRTNRPYLVNLAFGMLGDIGAAEDAVQEAFVRLTAAGNQIDDHRGWLIVVTSRICLDQINSARFRRERTHDTNTIEFVGDLASQAHPVDPADRVTLDDEVRSALLVVLERLTPAERVVFVLHDIFQTPFESIAETVGRPAATCRQLARRARLKISDDHGRLAGDVDVAQHRLLADRFIQACAVGDLSALVPLLDPDVWGDADLGPLDRRTGVANHGSNKVARNLMHWFGGTTLVCDPIGDHSELLAYVDRQLYAVVQLSIDENLVKRIHVIADPAKLDAISATTR